MMKHKILLIVFLSFGTIINAQQRNSFTSNNKSTVSIPDTLTRSTQDIANYINSNFISKEDKVKAVFIWLAENIEYDIGNMFAFKEHTNNINDRTLKTRKGVCLDYAKLFHDITNKIGVKSYVVLGYTKDQGLVNYNPHAWCVAMIGSSWYTFDPTWGAGFIKDSRYIKQLNMDYYKMSSKKAIKSHMPFDPLWQFLEYPLTNHNFCKGKRNADSSKPFFNYKDTLKNYETQSDIERLIAIKRRTESSGIKSYLIFTRIKLLENEIQTHYTNNVYKRYSSAKNDFNNGIYLLNRFIDFRNNHFYPDKGDAHLIEMIVEIEDAFGLSKENLDSIENPEPYTLSLMNHLYKSIEGATTNLDRQKVFLDKLLETNKNYRKSLFYDKM
jgi:hypothetical protein